MANFFRRLSFFLPLLALLALNGCQTPPRSEKAPSDSQVLFNVPIKNLENLGSLRPGIDAKLNDEALSFLIDTGSTYHIRFLTKKEFDPSKFERSEVLMSQYFGGFGIMTLQPFNLAIDQHEKNMRKEGKAMVSPDYLLDVRGIISPQSYDRDTTMILDFPRRRLIAIKGNVGAAREWAQQHYPGKPFQLLKAPSRQDRLWVVPASLLGLEKVNVLLDTGAFVTHFRSNYLKPGNAKVQKQDNTQIGDVWGNIYPTQLILEQKLLFADKTFDVPKVALDGPLANLDEDIKGIIGMDILQKAIMIVPWYESGELLVSFE